MSSFCSTKFLLLLVLFSAVPLAILIALETSRPQTHVFHYRSKGWFRESAKYDDVNRRFIVSFMEGGLGQIPVPEIQSPAAVLDEISVVKDAEVTGNASLGLVIDRPRNRTVVAIADVVGNRYGAVAAYDLFTWERLFLTQLSGPGDEKSFADDVAVDAEGNAYVTDTKGNKIWKVGPKGEFLSVIRDPLFSPKEWYKSVVGLNGVLYHPDGYLLVIHTFSGNLLKVDLSQENNNDVRLVKVEGSLLFGDGMELLSPTKLVVVGNPYTKLVESSDGWETAAVVGKFRVRAHRLATAATVKDGKAYISHIIGMGYPEKKHALVEALF